MRPTQAAAASAYTKPASLSKLVDCIGSDDAKDVFVATFVSGPVEKWCSAYDYGARVRRSSDTRAARIVARLGHACSQTRRVRHQSGLGTRSSEELRAKWRTLRASIVTAAQRRAKHRESMISDHIALHGIIGSTETRRNRACPDTSSSSNLSHVRYHGTTCTFISSPGSTHISDAPRIIAAKPKAANIHAHLVKGDSGPPSQA